MQHVPLQHRGKTVSPASRPLWISMCTQILIAAVPSRRVALRAALMVALIGPLLLGFGAADVLGCPTCKDGVIASDDAASNIARGYFYSILLMLAMPFTLAGCFGMYVWREYRRQQRAGVFDRVPAPRSAYLPDIGPLNADSSGPVSPPAPPIAAGSHAS